MTRRRFLAGITPCIRLGAPSRSASRRCDQDGRQDQRRPGLAIRMRTLVLLAGETLCFCLYRFANSHRDALMAPTSSPTKMSTPIGIAATFCLAARATMTSNHANHPSCFTTGWSSSTVILRCDSSAADRGSNSWIWSNAGITLVDVDLCWASIIRKMFPFLRARRHGTLARRCVQFPHQIAQYFARRSFAVLPTVQGNEQPHCAD